MKIPNDNHLALELYEKHQKNFDKSANILKEEYDNFTNKEKIITLLDYYIYTINVVLFCYKIDGLKSFSNSNNMNAAEFASKYENIDSLFTGKKEMVAIKIGINFSNFLIKFIPHIVFSGSPIKNSYEKILLRVSKSILISLPIKKNKTKKNKIVKILLSYFKDNISIKELKLIEIYLDSNLPKIFWSEPINNYIKKIIKIKVSPYAVFEMNGLEDIFLINNKIYLEGMQHGGGYFSFKNFIWEKYEIKLSDKFIGWGLSETHNLKQQRFKKNKLTKKFNRNERDIIWIESGTPSKFDYFFDTEMILMATNQKTKDYIYSELITSKKKFYNKPHPRFSTLYKKYSNLNIINKDLKGEKFIFNNSIVIFDITGSTLLHHCIEQYDTIFIIVTSKKDLNKLSYAQLEWYNVLRENKLWFFNNETNLLANRIREIVDSELKLPDSIKKFHERIFI